MGISYIFGFTSTICNENLIIVGFDLSKNRKTSTLNVLAGIIVLVTFLLQLAAH